MPILLLDERRRITLPKEVAGSGRKFVAIKTREGILLKALPEDPIKALQEEGKKLKGVSFEELKKAGEEEGLREAERTWERVVRRR